MRRRGAPVHHRPPPARGEPAGHLSLVPPTTETRKSRTKPKLAIPPSRRLDAFAARSAEAGLTTAAAARLAIERALALADAPLFDLDAATARVLLRRAAARARPQQPLAAATAAYVRTLTATRATTPDDVARGLTVDVPDRLACRLHAGIPPTAFDAEAVPDLVAWEVAATLEGRTIGEWALEMLAAVRLAA